MYYTLYIHEEQEKIQNLQQIEIDKLKNLLGFREQEAVDHMSSIRQYQQQIDNINQEMDRLRTIEPIAQTQLACDSLWHHLGISEPFVSRWFPRRPAATGD